MAVAVMVELCESSFRFSSIGTLSHDRICYDYSIGVLYWYRK